MMTRSAKQTEIKELPKIHHTSNYSMYDFVNINISIVFLTSVIKPLIMC